MTSFNTSREIPAPLEEVFAAISNPKRLAHWWGPEGFTNTFNICEFKNGGRWSFVMHGPDGQNYPNENVFTEIKAPSRIVIKHIVEPKFSLSISLTESKKGTLVSWSQTFESPEIAANLEKIVVPANEQNLDRLSAEVLSKKLTPSLQFQIDEINARNQRVEADKAWETSLARKSIIALLTYAMVVLFFSFADLPSPFINAIVPSIGFLLSTFSIPIFKKLWTKHWHKK
jgi:uncharacterized protein YndB with AHSA1/START domain